MFCQAETTIIAAAAAAVQQRENRATIPAKSISKWPPLFHTSRYVLSVCGCVCMCLLSLPPHSLTQLLVLQNWQIEL